MQSEQLRVLLGFFAGALAVLVFHQGMYLLLKQLGVPLPGMPWNMAPAVTAYGIPTLFNQMFWGGIWGILFALVFARLPGHQAWLKGFVFGMVFPMLLGSWLVVAMIKGQPLFSGLFSDGNFLRLRNGFLLNGVAYGIGIGMIYPMLMRLAGRSRDISG